MNGENQNPEKNSESEEKEIKTPNSPLRSFSYRMSLKALDKIEGD